MKAKSWIIIGLSAVTTLIAIERLHSYHNGRFSVSKLLSPHPQVLEVPPRDIDTLLNQKFHFFGKGCTSFVFLGEDGKTILKFFNHSHLLFTSSLFKISFPGIADFFRVRKLLEKKKQNSAQAARVFFQ